MIIERVWHRATAIVVATGVAIASATTAAHAEVPSLEREATGSAALEPVVITADSVVFTLTAADGTERVVSLQEFTTALASTPSLSRQRGDGYSTNAVGRIEGSWYKTSNIYFNRDETNRIAAGAGVVYMLPASVPNAVVQAIRVAAAGVVVWAGIAITTGSCVGIKTPITVGPRVPLPIYHRSGFCY